MNKKIKVIELWNINAQIEDSKKIPKKIKYNGDVYELQMSRDYYSCEKHEYLTNMANSKRLDIFLNDYVEILEDNTEKQENLGESWKEVGKRVGEWAKEFEQGFKESFTEIVRYPFEKLEDNTEEIEELPKMNFFELVTDEVKTAMAMEKIKFKVDELIKAVNKIRKDFNK